MSELELLEEFRAMALRALRRYDPERDGMLRIVGTYREGNGVRHTVGYIPSLAGTGVVIDIAHGRAMLVDQLLGADDREPQLICVARDYLEQMERHLAGERLEHPAPKAPRVRFNSRWRSAKRVAA